MEGVKNIQRERVPRFKGKRPNSVYLGEVYIKDHFPVV